MSSLFLVPPLAAGPAVALLLLCVWAGAADLLTRVIPNTLVLMIAGLFAVFAGAAGFSVWLFLSHVACSFAVLVTGFVLYSNRLLGGGDAKLLAAASMWFGFEVLPDFLMFVGLSGGVLALTWLAAPVASARACAGKNAGQQIPYGIAIASGVLLIFPEWLAGL